MLPHQSVFLGEHRGNVYIKKINMNHLSPRTHLNLYIFEWKFYPQLVYAEWWSCLILQVRRKKNVNTWSNRLYRNWLKITCPTFFQRGAYHIIPMVSPRDCRLSRKCVKNVPAYLQSRKGLHSSVFEEIHKHRFFKKKLFSQYYMVRITT